MLNLLLKNIAATENLSAQGNMSLRDVTNLMTENGKGVVIILQADQAVGILTERDVVDLLYKGFELDERADRFALKTLVTTRGDRTVGHALNLTIENDIRRVIVTDESGAFLGVVTQQDLLKYLEEDFYRSTIKVKHIVDKLDYIISVSPDEHLKQVLKVMVENKISAVAVMRSGVVEGIITEKDILSLACSGISLQSEVRDHMSSPVITVHFDTALVDVVTIMNDKNIRRVIVTNNDGFAVNIVTIRDVIRNLDGDYSKFLERKLRNAKEILNLLPEMLLEITDMGSDQLIVWANEKVITKLGIGILDQPVTGLIPGEHWESVYSTIKKIGRIENIRIKRGSEIYELSGFYIQTKRGSEVGRIQLIMRDITEDIRLSTTDPLTGLYNRRFLNEFLIKEVARSRRLDKKFSIVLFDIDDFKRINDRFGHACGDQVLQSLAQLMMGKIRNLDVIGRYGGDEFIIILPETNGENAASLIERLRGIVEKYDIVLSASALHITASFGVATFPDDGMSLDDLLVAADERLYSAKSQGKNRVVH